jgi:hypothetical protein
VIRLLTLSLLCTAQLALAQASSRVVDVNRHAWLAYSGDHRVAGRWGLHIDGQWRRAEMGTRWQQYQIRPGLNFAASRGVLLTVGYAFTKTFPYGEFPLKTSVPEHRIYQQALITHFRGWMRVQHRIRMEQRFIRYPDPQPRKYTYQNRFRYMLRGEIPLVSKAGDGRLLWYLPVSNEVAVGLPPNYGSRPWDQNRLFVGVGRAMPQARVEVGYMNQLIGQRNGRIFESNNTLVVTVTSGFPLSRLWGDN